MYDKHNELLKWSIANATTTSNSFGEKKIDKQSQKNRIDPVDAIIDAWKIMLLNKEKKEMDNRCDGMLWYDKAVVFVELKERESKKSKNDWVKDGEKQLKRTIEYFEKTEQSNKFIEKRAYIANKAHPIFKESQFQRMKNFKEETGYTLRIENRIKIPYMNF